VAGGGDGGAGRRRRPEEAAARGGRWGGATSRRRAAGARRPRRASAGAAGRRRRREAVAQGWDRESERRERRRKKSGAKFIFLLCRVPAIWHSTKIFFIFKISFAECHPGGTRQSILCRVSPADTRQSTLVFFCFGHQTFCGFFLHYVDLHVPFGDNYNCVCNI
jgi:hypothetical protein